MSKRPTRLLLLAWTASTLITSGPAWALESFPLSLPDGCHAQLRSGLVFSAAPPIEAFKRGGFLESYDVLCIGKTITISEPLRSSGGNVIILAERLNLRASIDTRPYFRKRSARPYAGSDAFPKAYESAYRQYGVSKKNQSWLKSKEAVVEEVFGYDKFMKSLFQGYYELCVDCIRSGDEVWMPELPSGLTPTFINWPLFDLAKEVKNVIQREGVPPLEGTDRDLASSGDISLFVQSLQLPSNIPSKRTAPDPLSCSKDQPFELALLEAGGARGGRGGLGQPNECMGDPINRRRYSGYSCISGPGGKSSRGGPGGKGGDIYVGRIGDFALDFSAVANIAGGPGAGTGIFRMPRNWKPPGICQHKTQQQTEANANGADGHISSSIITLAEAWSAVQLIADTLDGFFVYDITELGRRAELDERVSALSFGDYLNLAAKRLELDALRSFSEELPRLVAAPLGQASSLNAAQGYWAWDGSLRSNDLPASTEASLRTIQELSADSTLSRLTSFISRHGGLLDLINSNAQLDLSLRRIREVLGAQLDAAERIRAALEKINVGITEIKFFPQLEKAEADVEAAKISIHAKLAEFERDKARFKGEWKDAERMYIEGFVGLVSMGAAGAANSSDFEPAAKKIGTALLKMATIKPSTAPTFLELYKQLDDAKAKLSQLSRDAATERKRALEVQSKALLDAVESRRHGATELMNRSAAFPDLLKNAILTFVSSAARNRESLVRNLNSLSEFAGGQIVPGELVLLDEPAQLRDCADARGTPLDGNNWFEVENCLVVLPSESTRAVMGVIDGEPTLRDLKLPLLVLAPFTRGQKHFSLQGFSEVTVHDVR